LEGDKMIFLHLAQRRFAMECYFFHDAELGLTLQVGGGTFILSLIAANLVKCARGDEPLIILRHAHDTPTCIL
jgi:hypothetical protein